MSQSYQKNDEFWILNISDKNIVLADLRIVIKAKTSINLLGKGYRFTRKEVEDSLTSGSIYNKRNFLKKAFGPPQVIESKIQISKLPIERKPRSIVKIEKPVFEEWNFTDEAYAAEMAKDDDK